jgi:hypothetical protein
VKCVAWFPQGLDHFISLPFSFLTPDLSFHILGALVISRSILELFMVEVFHEDLGMIFSLLMLADPHVAYDALIMLCLTPLLLASYNVSISKYFVALC